jgi:hypothetical protein
VVGTLGVCGGRTGGRIDAVLGGNSATNDCRIRVNALSRSILSVKRVIFYPAKMAGFLAGFPFDFLSSSML